MVQYAESKESLDMWNPSTCPPVLLIVQHSLFQRTLDSKISKVSLGEECYDAIAWTQELYGYAVTTLQSQQKHVHKDNEADPCQVWQ